MARLARLVVPGLPHLMTRRGNRRETTFFASSVFEGEGATLPSIGSAWPKALEIRTGRPLLPGKRGPNAKATE